MAEVDTDREITPRPFTKQRTARVASERGTYLAYLGIPTEARRGTRYVWICSHEHATRYTDDAPHYISAESCAKAALAQYLAGRPVTGACGEHDRSAPLFAALEQPPPPPEDVPPVTVRRKRGPKASVLQVRVSTLQLRIAYHMAHGDYKGAAALRTLAGMLERCELDEAEINRLADRYRAELDSGKVPA